MHFGCLSLQAILVSSAQHWGTVHLKLLQTLPQFRMHFGCLSLKAIHVLSYATLRHSHPRPLRTEIVPHGRHLVVDSQETLYDLLAISP